MSRPRSPLYAGDWKRKARILCDNGYANPNARCTCGRTLAEHPMTRTGRPPRWSAGHPDGQHANANAIPVLQVLGCNLAERNERIRHRPAPQTFTSRRW